MAWMRQVNNLSYEDVRSSIKDGDVLMYRGRNIPSRVIQWATRSRYSHAGLAAWWNDRLMVLEAVGRDYLDLDLDVDLDVDRLSQAVGLRSLVCDHTKSLRWSRSTSKSRCRRESGGWGDSNILVPMRGRA